MDLSTTTAPDSTQINAEDLLAGPVTVTITGVRKGTDEQPVNIDLAEYPHRAYRPGKSMRRVLVAAWGPDSSAYIGRRLTLYRDAEIKFGGFATGGIRISHLSHIEKRMTLALTVTRGKRAPYVVEPLAAVRTPAVTTVKPDVPKVDGITAEQSKALFAALKDNDLDDRDDGLAYISGVIGRDITTSKELSKSEASRVIDSLDVPPAPENEPTLDGTEAP